MRAAPARVVALFGPSLAGKTAVAHRLSARVGYQVRSCGNIVKERARALGVAIEALSVPEHMAIDNATRELCGEPRGEWIVEGRYLDVVLSPESRCRFFELVCDAETRAQRLAAHASIQHSEARTIVAARDEEDVRLRAALYNSPAPTRRGSLIDTSRLTIDDVVGRLAAALDAE